MSARPFVTLVTGAPRSGTSLAMQMLEAGGLLPLSDGRRPADLDNPRGYYEYEAVKALPRGGVPPSWLAEAEGRALKVVHALLPALGTPLPPCRVVWMHRHSAAVLASQRVMLERRGHDADALSQERDAALLREELAVLEGWLARELPGRWLRLDYDAVLAEPALAAAALGRLLGGGLDEAAMARAVAPELRHHLPCEPAPEGEVELRSAGGARRGTLRRP